MNEKYNVVMRYGIIILVIIFLILIVLFIRYKIDAYEKVQIKPNEESVTVVKNIITEQKNMIYATQEENIKNDTQEENTKNDAQEENTKNDTQEENTKNDTQEESTKNDTQEESTKNDTQEESVKNTEKKKRKNLSVKFGGEEYGSTYLFEENNNEKDNEKNNENNDYDGVIRKSCNNSSVSRKFKQIPIFRKPNEIMTGYDVKLIDIYANKRLPKMHLDDPKKMGSNYYEYSNYAGPYEIGTTLFNKYNGIPIEHNASFPYTPSYTTKDKLGTAKSLEKLIYLYDKKKPPPQRKGEEEASSEG